MNLVDDLLGVENDLFSTVTPDFNEFQEVSNKDFRSQQG